MRGVKSTLALFVVLAALGGYGYYLSKQPEGLTPGLKMQVKVFDGLEQDKIEEIKITSAAGDATTLKKEGGAWQLKEPLAIKADETESSGIASSLASAELVRVVDENPADLNDYGLSNPRIIVNFKAAGDKEYRKLLIGEKSPTGSDLFAKRNDEKPIILIPAMLESSFNKTTFDLREKTVLKFERDKVDSVEVVAGGKTLAMTKDAAEWKLTKPVQVKADFGSVESLIGRLQSAQMKSIVSSTEPTPADIKKYGFDKPEATVTIGTGSSRAVLLVGGKADENTVYARDASKPDVVTIEKSLVDDVKKGADEYRRKDLFEFRAFNANRVEITRGAQTLVFERVKGQGDNAQDKWRRVSPNAADADRDKVDGLLSRLANMRATTFVETTAKTGLDKPAMVVFVKFDDSKKEERITFGKEGEDIFVSRPGEPGAMKTDSADFTEINKTLDELAK